MKRLIEFQKTLNKKIGQRESLLQSKKDNNILLSQHKRESRNIVEAQFILQTVSKQTQKEISFYLANLVTLALAASYDDPYTFELEFIEKRGRTEAIPTFIRNKKKYLPGKQTGCGPVDIASLALRLALWCINKQNISSTFLLDEPFKNLDGEAMSRAANLLTHLSKELKIQFIIFLKTVPDDPLLIAANKTFRIKKEK